MNLDPRWLKHNPDATPTADESARAENVHVIGLNEVAGTPGPSGKSAYQVWLEEGNTGTPDEFLASLKGLQGDPGGKGPEGTPGARGPAGQSITVAGFVDKLGDLPTNLTEANAGELWVSMEFGHAHFWTGTAWTDAGKVVGPEGPKGEPGIDGTTGGIGPAGPGVPNGGLTGQILSKRTAADQDTVWVSNEHLSPIVSQGNLTLPPKSIDLILNNVKVTIYSSAATLHGLRISTVSGEEVVDFRVGGHYDGAGTEYYTIDSQVINTTPRIMDNVILNSSRDPSEFWLRENGRMWRGHAFVSGPGGERSTLWAQRIV